MLFLLTVCHVYNCIVYVTSRFAAQQLGHQLAMHLRAAHAHLRRHSNLAFGPFGMTADQYVLLTVLEEQGEATQQELVRRCYSDTATIGTMVSLLQAKGFVTRMPHPQDGRALRVSLTPQGVRLARHMRRSSAWVRSELVALFSEKELRTLIEFLARVAGAMHPPRRTQKISQPRIPKLISK